MGDLNFITEFSKILYKIRVTSDANQGLVENVTGVDSVGLNESVQYTVTPKSGWKIESVTFNGQALEKNAHDTYTVTAVDGENEFAVSYVKVEVEAQAPQPENTPSDTTPEPLEKENGNGVAALFIALGVGFAVAFGTGIALVLRRKKDEE